MTRNGHNVPAIHSKSPGIASGFETAIRFHLWASTQQATPTWQAIQSMFNVSRATAHRWRRAWMDAVGRFA